jgi:hypothetical protein
MPARISLVTDVADAEKHLGAGARLAGTPPNALMATLAKLAEHLPPTSTLHLALDHGGEYFAAVEDDARHYPHGERFALGKDGSIARADVDEPTDYREVEEFLLTSEMSIEAVSQIAESALDAFWDRVATLMPGLTGDMAPGETDSLEQIALLTVAVWITNNHPQFAGEEHYEKSAALREAAQDHH